MSLFIGVDYIFRERVNAILIFLRLNFSCVHDAAQRETAEKQIPLTNPPWRLPIITPLRAAMALQTGVLLIFESVT